MKQISNSDYAMLLRCIIVVTNAITPCKNLKLLNAIRLLRIFVHKHKHKEK